MVWNKLYKKKLFISQRFDENAFFEDEAISYRLLFNADGIAYNASALYCWVQRPTSKVHGKNADIDIIRVKYFYLMGKFYSTVGHRYDSLAFLVYAKTINWALYYLKKGLLMEPLAYIIKSGIGMIRLLRIKNIKYMLAYRKHRHS